MLSFWPWAFLSLLFSGSGLSHEQRRLGQHRDRRETHAETCGVGWEADRNSGSEPAHRSYGRKLLISGRL
jgi:hypothetical protein